jgi:hypothetical protein
VLRCVRMRDELRGRVAGRAPAVWAGRVPWAGHWERFGLA